MLSNLFCDMEFDWTWIIIIALVFLLISGEDSPFSSGGCNDGFLGGLFEDNGIIILILLALLFLDF